MTEQKKTFKGDFMDERRAGAPSAFRQVMFHLRVLRAGWGLLLFTFVFSSCVLIESLLIEHYRQRHGVRSWFLAPTDILNPLIAFLAVIIATVVPSFFEQRQASVYGLRGSPWRLLGIGIGTGGALVAVTEIALRLRHILVPVASRTSIPGTLRNVFLWAGIFGMFALMEELLTRGYLQYTLTRGLAFLYRRFLGLQTGVAAGFWTAAVLTSLLFMALYRGNPGQTDMGLACIVVMGLVYCWSLWRTGSLWWALGFHGAWDFTQGFVFMQWDGGLPIRDHVFAWVAADPLLLSGGRAGLNGSVLAYLLLVIAFASLLLLKKARVYPELWAAAEDESRDHAMAGSLPDPGRA